MKQPETTLWRQVLLFFVSDMQDFTERWKSRKRIGEELKQSVREGIESFNCGVIDGMCIAADVPLASESKNFMRLINECKDILQLWYEANVVKLMYREQHIHILDGFNGKKKRDHFVNEREIFNNYVEARRS